MRPQTTPGSALPALAWVRCHLTPFDDPLRHGAGRFGNSFGAMLHLRHSFHFRKAERRADRAARPVRFGKRINLGLYAQIPMSPSPGVWLRAVLLQRRGVGAADHRLLGVGDVVPQQRQAAVKAPSTSISLIPLTVCAPVPPTLLTIS